MVKVVGQTDFTEKQIQQVKNRKDWSDAKRKAFVMEMQIYNMRSMRGDFDRY